MLLHKKPNQSGFTIVELMLAMTVFSVMLVAAAAGLIQVGRMYYKSVISTRTQDTTRLVIDEISRSIQFSGEAPRITIDGDDNVEAVCIGSDRYTPNIGEQAGVSGEPALLKDEAIAGCPPATAVGGGIELLSENMRLNRFEVELISGSTDQYRITVWTAYGDDDVLEDDPNDAERKICTSSGPGGEFCAISELSTVVSRRIL